MPYVQLYTNYVSIAFKRWKSKSKEGSLLMRYTQALKTWVAKLKTEPDGARHQLDGPGESIWWLMFNIWKIEFLI